LSGDGFSCGMGKGIRLRGAQDTARAGTDVADRQQWARRDWVTMASSAGLVVLIAAMIGGAIAVIGGGSSASAVTLEPAAQIGADPFTASVAIGPVVDFPGNVRAITVATRKTFAADPKTHTLIATATTPGLYGGTGDAHVCDPQQVVKFLQQNPQKGAAWAGVLGISPSGIAAYVGSLTPVVLTSDTLVTNHGYHDGHATTLQSVLQAGTAVMVDATGAPRVKCNCGNPLTAPEPIAPTHTRGTPWPGYAPTQVTVVQPGPKTETISVVNITTGDVYSQPAGGAGAGGEFVVATQDALATRTTISTSADGNTWNAAGTVGGLVHGLAWGDGKWLAVNSAQRSGNSSQILESSDLRTWRSVATIPSVVNDIAYHAGLWVAVGGVVTGTDEMAGEFPDGAVYSSTDGHAWSRVAVVADAPQFTSVEFGAGTWVAVGNGIHQGGEESLSFVSKDTKHWTGSNGETVGDQNFGQLAFGSGQWVLGGTRAMMPTDGAMVLSHDGAGWTPAARFTNDPIRGVAYRAGEWMAVGVDTSATTYQGTSTTVLVSSDGKSWSKRGHLATLAVDLAFGGNTPSGGTTSTPASATPSTTPSTQAASSLASVDWRNYTYEDRTCGSLDNEHKPVHLTNGKYQSSDGFSNPPGTPDCGMTIDAVTFADVTGDGAPDAIITGSAFFENIEPWTLAWTTVFAASPNGPKNLGYFDGTAYPPYSAAGITVWSGISGGVLCCAATYEEVTYTYSKATGKFAQTAKTNVAPSQAPAPIVKASGG